MFKECGIINPVYILDITFCSIAYNLYKEKLGLPFVKACIKRNFIETNYIKDVKIINNKIHLYMFYRKTDFENLLKFKFQTIEFEYTYEK